MAEFTASNGVTLNTDVDRDTESIRIHDVLLVDREVKALREYFERKRDQERGLVRLAEHPHLEFYPLDEDRVLIHNPSIREAEIHTRETGGGWAGAAAQDYFDSWKPWHGAKPGEVWVLDAENGHDGPHYVEESDEYMSGIGFRAIPPRLGRGHGIGRFAPIIRDARRIWPEED